MFTKGMKVIAGVSGIIVGTVIYALDDCCLIEYKARTVYGGIVMREWFDNWCIKQVQP